METAGRWLENALEDLCQSMNTGLDLDGEIISGLVSYCELASPTDAKEYLDNIIGEETGKHVIAEYMQRRSCSNLYSNAPYASTSGMKAYIKPPSDERLKKPIRTHKDIGESRNKIKEVHNETGDSKKPKNKKSGKIVSLAEASKGSVVFQKGKPCSCQVRRHKLMNNCLSCGKIICEQEGEGPCSFCGANVLKESTTYESVIPVSNAEAMAEAYAKRLVEYDRDSAARTKVIDDQSDYYELEGNSWVSMEEKELLRKKREEVEEAERARRKKVVVTFDLFGRKVLINEDEVSKLESDQSIMRPLEERQVNRIKPNPNLALKPVFEPNPRRKQNKRLENGLCLEITGRVQHDSNQFNHFRVHSQEEELQKSTD